MNIHLVRNALWVLVDKVFILVGGLIVYVIVSKHIGPEKFGLLSFGVALSSIPIIFSQWGANHIIYNEAVRSPKIASAIISKTEKPRAYLYLSVSLVILLLLFIFSSKSTESIIFVFLIVVSHFFLGLDSYQHYFNGILDSKVNAISNFKAKITSIFSRLLFVYFSFNYFFFFVPYFINNFILLYSRRKDFKKRSRSYDIDNVDIDVKKIHKEKSGLLWTGLLTLIYTKVCEFIIVYFLGYSELGFYAMSFTIGSAWIFVLQAFLISYLAPAILDENYINKVKKLSSIHSVLIFMSIPVIICYWFLSPYFVEFILGEEFSVVADLMPIIAIGAMLSTLGTLCNRIIASFDGGSNYLFYKTLNISVLSVFIYSLAIYLYGLVGVCWAVVFIEFVSLTVGNYFFHNGIIGKVHRETLVLKNAVDNFNLSVR